MEQFQHNKNGVDSNSKTYRDFAKVTDDQIPVNDHFKTVNTSGSRKKDANFPVRLHYMLSEIEKDGLQHVVSWQPHGRCFKVHDQKVLEQCVLPLWFSQSKFKSFQRQLNIYGFTRVTEGPDSGSYYHEMFLRGKQFLASFIPRIKIKGEGPRKADSAKSNPNFYEMPFLAQVTSECTTREAPLTPSRDSRCTMSLTSLLPEKSGRDIIDTIFYKQERYDLQTQLLSSCTTSMLNMSNQKVPLEPVTSNSPVGGLLAREISNETTHPFILSFAQPHHQSNFLSPALRLAILQAIEHQGLPK